MSSQEDYSEIREAARRYAREKLLPGYTKRERANVLERGIVRELGQLGFLGADLPEQHGGLGVSGLAVGQIVEEIAYGDYSIANLPIQTSLMGTIIARNATEETAKEWLAPMIGGEIITAICLTEPRAGSDAANLGMRATRSGSDYILNGEKTSITFGAIADMYIVFARTDPDGGARGVTAFVVPANAKGLSRTAFDDVGCRIIGRGSIFFDDVRVPEAYRLGGENQGFTKVMSGFDYSRALIALMAIGCAQASLDEAWAYTTQREAFGAPIAQYQGVTFPLAEQETYLAAARQLSYHTLELRDQGKPHTAEAAMVKWFGPKTAFDAMHQALLTYGHYGYSLDSPHQQRMRDVLGHEIGDGMAGIMKLIIARERVGRAAVQYKK
ncbi:MAG: acyl-CoA dehydrogenase family protein [Hyphomonadaceae bacterium]